MTLCLGRHKINVLCPPSPRIYAHLIRPPQASTFFASFGSAKESPRGSFSLSAKATNTVHRRDYRLLSNRRGSRRCSKLSTGHRTTPSNVPVALLRRLRRGRSLFRPVGMIPREAGGYRCFRLRLGPFPRLLHGGVDSRGKRAARQAVRVSDLGEEQVGKAVQVEALGWGLSSAQRRVKNDVHC